MSFGTGRSGGEPRVPRRPAAQHSRGGAGPAATGTATYRRHHQPQRARRSGRLPPGNLILLLGLFLPIFLLKSEKTLFLGRI